jgi:hypothetical protein
VVAINPLEGEEAFSSHAPVIIEYDLNL